MAFAVSHPREMVRGGEGREGGLHWRASAESITWKLLIRGALNSYWTAQNGNLMPDLGVAPSLTLTDLNLCRNQLKPQFPYIEELQTPVLKINCRGYHGPRHFRGTKGYFVQMQFKGTKHVMVHPIFKSLVPQKSLFCP